MRRVVILGTLLAATACGSILAFDPPSFEPSPTEAGADEAATVPIDAPEPVDGSSEGSAGDARDARVDASDGACTQFAGSCPPNTLCSVDRTCIPPLEAGAACKASRECASGRCARDGSVCTESPAICAAHLETCFVFNGEPCCLGMRCTGSCVGCFVSGEACTNAQTCCSQVCEAGFCQ